MSPFQGEGREFESRPSLHLNPHQIPIQKMYANIRLTNLIKLIMNKTVNAYSTGLLQGIAYNRLNKKLTVALLPFNISIPEWKLLGQLYDHNNLRLSALADYLSYDPPMITKIAKQLEKRELITRQQDNNDERAKIITITDKGRALIEELEPVVKTAIRELLVGVTQEELAIYIKVLSVIVENTN